ncbi:hypothetical protein D3879_14775 [Pseudomonas cavernicola]|uniref:Ead/Ea22-like family protein n=1 Tax=Pseudomonas cavernicola TaxID=2320866 RepID=A0A418XEX4_9PSED|nr:hypothetical protein [Pseudomonas cavernicola]RJG10940.1 hypothetical protein D3879_14775 [Pseudomonas cavernicola]
MADYSELKRRALALKSIGMTAPFSAEHNQAAIAYRCVSTHDIILALLAENERLEATKKALIVERSAQLEQLEPLRAEVEALRRDAARWKWLEGSADSATWEHIGYQAQMNRHLHVDAAMSKGGRADG